MKPQRDREEWILQETKKLGAVDILNADFVNRFADFSGSRLVFKCWGAHGCPQLSRDLSEMARKGLLRRQLVGLSGAWQPGFPRWVYSYRIDESRLTV